MSETKCHYTHKDSTKEKKKNVLEDNSVQDDVLAARPFTIEMSHTIRMNDS